MSNFTTNNKIAEIVEHDSNLLSVLNRFGIKLGFGDISVHQACINNNIDKDFFLEILNVYHNDNYFPEHKFANFKIIDIISYLIETHKSYTTHTLPEIDRLFNQLLSTNTVHKDLFQILEKIYSSFKDEFNNHIKYEEQKIFPLIIKLANNEKELNHNKIKLSDFNFINIHSQFDDKIIDIKNILIKYLPPIEDTFICNAFAIAIFKFEKDLKDHSRIEDRILYPRVNHLYNQSTSSHVEE